MNLFANHESAYMIRNTSKKELNSFRVEPKSFRVSGSTIQINSEQEKEDFLIQPDSHVARLDKGYKHNWNVQKIMRLATYRTEKILIPLFPTAGISR